MPAFHLLGQQFHRIAAEKLYLPIEILQRRGDQIQLDDIHNSLIKRLMARVIAVIVKHQQTTGFFQFPATIYYLRSDNNILKQLKPDVRGG